MMSTYEAVVYILTQYFRPRESEFYIESYVAASEVEVVHAEDTIVEETCD